MKSLLVNRLASASVRSPGFGRSEVATTCRLKPGLRALRAFVVSLSLATLRAGAGDATATTATAIINDTPKVLVLVGAPGEADFGTNFLNQAHAWELACTKAGAERVTLGTTPREPEPTNAPAAPVAASPSTNPPPATDLAELEQILTHEPLDGTRPLWLVLVGHGTYDGQDSKFNLRGPDLSGTQLATWLKPFRRPVAVINTASASAPFIPKLAATNRVIITATRSGNEQNYTRFGDYFALALSDPASDLDQDGQTSLLEAFLSTAARVADFYKTAGRLATEHALLDDNGDGLGTPPDWFRGLRATKRAKDGASLDGLRAHQFHLIRSPEEALLDPATRAKRDELERQIALLRDRQDRMKEADYYAQLEALLLDLAQLYEGSSKK